MSLDARLPCRTGPINFAKSEMPISLELTPAAADGRPLFFKFAFAIGVMIAGLEIGYLLHSPLPYDPVGYLVGRDFANTWLGAELALSGHPQT
jgi:hypothetical protein